MASIRLFGRGKSASAANETAGGGPAVDVETIAAALADLSTAAVSTTWRCRHASGASIGEGAVDFGAHRSRATVIRGTRTYEYVRAGSSVYRALVPEEGGEVAALPEPEPGEDDETEEFEGSADELGEDGEASGDDGEAAMEADADPDGEGVEGESEDDGEPGDDKDEGELEASDASEDGDEEDGEASDDEDEVEESQSLGVEKDADSRAWQTFSEHDVCGPHSYAEPAVLAQAVRRAGVVQPRKAEEFDGVTLSAFSVTVKPKPADPDKLLARLARQLRDHGANTVVVTAFMADRGDLSTGDPDTEEADDDAKPRIVRLRLELPHWTPADDPTADHAISVDLYELGDPVQIELPDRDRSTRRTSRSCADLSLF
jgi:hypothetical protein